MKHFRLQQIAVVAASLLLPAMATQAASVNTIYNFGVNNSPVFPTGLVAYQGLLYGTTFQGGINNVGTVYRINPKNNVEKTLHSFGGSPDGMLPSAALTVVNGILYGTTEEGGTNDTGTVFSINPATGATAALYSFPFNIGLGNPDGAYPQSSLFYLNGILYGTATAGGTADEGVIYSVNVSTQTEAVVYNFAGGSDGAIPSGGLIYYGGSFYGVTTAGGANGLGVLYKYNPSTGAETLLHTFRGGKDGSAPQGQLLAYNGKLYGTTYMGGAADAGTVYAIDPKSGAETILHSFTGAPDKDHLDGANPYAGLVQYKGILYGTTWQGGAYPYNLGSVFSVDPVTQVTTLLYSFTGMSSDGGLPASPLTVLGGALYGTNTAGGTFGQGTVFKLTP
jgi:uncharacterized repeat protein (TIGR03803 family)